MKTTPLHFALFVALACLGSLRAQTVSGLQLEIGPTGSNQVYGNLTSGAIGSNNWVSGNGTLAVGTSNSASAGSLAIGEQNEIGGLPLFSSCSIVVGFDNTNLGNCSVLSGIGNFAQSDWETFWSAQACLGSGMYNFFQFSAKSSLISGINNYIAGDYDLSVPDFYNVEAATALGRGLINQWSDSTILGRYNDSAQPFRCGLLFAIGNGADAMHRSNAFEVYADGKITMPRQGDILMGEFGNAGD